MTAFSLKKDKVKEIDPNDYPDYGDYMAAKRAVKNESASEESIEDKEEEKE